MLYRIRMWIGGVLNRVTRFIAPELGRPKKLDPESIASDMSEEDELLGQQIEDSDSTSQIGIQYVGEMDIPKMIAKAGVPQVEHEKGGEVFVEPDSPKKDVNTGEGWKIQERKVDKRFPRPDVKLG